MLKQDNFYPECGVCETNLFTQKAANKHHTFWCAHCRSSWENDEFGLLFDQYDRQKERQYILYHVAGYSYDEIARGSPLTASQVKDSIRNIRIRMKERLGDVPREGGRADPATVTLTPLEATP